MRNYSVIRTSILSTSFFLSATLSLALCGVAAAQDQGMTSETHKKNVGKIVWAKQRIQFNLQDSLKYEETFDSMDPLYGRVYLPKSLLRLSQDQGGKCENANSEFEVRAFLNDKSMGAVNQNRFKSSDWTTVQINLKLSSGDKEDDTNPGVPRRWANVVNSLPAGQHRVRVEFWGGTKECLQKYADGQFALVKSTAAKIDVPSPIPAPQKRDPRLEAAMIKVMERQQWQNEKPIKVVIVEPDWRMIRNPLGVILRREINTNIILAKTDGTCRLTDISFTEQHQGGGKYGPTELHGIGLKNIPVDCAEVK